MKYLLTMIFVFWLNVLYSQSAQVQQPVEQRYHISYWWWVLGVLLAIGAGIIIYMLIKKDPKKDAVR